MVFKKTLLSLMFVMIGFAQNLKAKDQNERDVQGRTELMNYVITSQNVIEVIEQDITRLWHVCYEYANVTTYNGYGYSHSHTQIQVRRKVSCLDEDIRAHKQRQADLIAYKAAVMEAVEYMVQSSDQQTLAAYDMYGKTVLNYCTHSDIYNLLRQSGVPFQYDAWAYNYRGSIIVSSTILTLVTIALYKNGYLTEKAFVQLGENIKSGAIKTLNGIKDFVANPLTRTASGFHACIDAIYDGMVFVACGLERQSMSYSFNSGY